MTTQWFNMVQIISAEALWTQIKKLQVSIELWESHVEPLSSSKPRYLEMEVGFANHMTRLGLSTVRSWRLPKQSLPFHPFSILFIKKEWQLRNTSYVHSDTHSDSIFNTHRLIFSQTHLFNAFVQGAKCVLVLKLASNVFCANQYVYTLLVHLFLCRSNTQVLVRSHTHQSCCMKQREKLAVRDFTTVSRCFKHFAQSHCISLPFCVKVETRPCNTELGHPANQWKDTCHAIRSWNTEITCTVERES